MTAVEVEVQVGTTPDVDATVQIEPPTFTVISVLPTGPRGPQGIQGPEGPEGPAGEGGSVDSVNGETGDVILTAADVGADPAGTAATAVATEATARAAADTALDGRLDIIEALGSLATDAELATEAVARAAADTAEATARASADSALDGRVDTLEAAPPAHAASHADGGSDEIAISADQVTSGAFADARIPAAITRDSELAAAVALLQALSEKNQANGYAGLDGTGKIPTSLLPLIAVTDVSVVADITARDALTVQEGDVAIVLDATDDPEVDSGGASYIFDGTDWQRMVTPDGGGAVSSVDGRTGVVTLSDLYQAAAAYLTTLAGVGSHAALAAALRTAALDAAYAAISRTISAGAGLTGGGDLSANRTLALAFPIDHTGATAGTDVFTTDVTGDSVDRFVLDHDGTQSWGPGNAALDNDLKRLGAGVLGVTLGQFRKQGAAGTDAAFSSLVTGDANPMWRINVAGTQSWGPGAGTAVDTTLSRRSAGVLGVGLSAGGDGDLVARSLQASGKTGATATPITLGGGTASGAPASGAHVKGELVVDDAGDAWLCTVAGTPGTWIKLLSGTYAPLPAYAGYTPTIKGGATTVTTSSLVARYMQIGKLVHAYGKAVVSSAGAANGAVTVTLPVAANTSSDVYPCGTGDVQDISNANGRYRSLTANIVTSGGYIRFFRDAVVTDVEVGANPAFTLASGDVIAWGITYEAA